MTVVYSSCFQINIYTKCKGRVIKYGFLLACFIKWNYYIFIFIWRHVLLTKKNFRVWYDPIVLLLHIHTHTHTHTHTHSHTHTHTHTHKHMHKHKHKLKLKLKQMYMQTYTRTHTYTPVRLLPSSTIITKYNSASKLLRSAFLNSVHIQIQFQYAFPSLLSYPVKLKNPWKHHQLLNTICL